MRAATATLLLTAIASLGLTTAASAADLPARTYTKAPEYVPTPPCGWCGWYIGVNGGGAWDDRSGNLTGFTTTFTPEVAVGLTPSALGAKHQGAFGGGQFGYNWAVSNWLVGFEADIQGADIGKTNTTAASSFLSSVSTGRDHIDWFGTVRGRLGAAFGNVMFYGTGGLAYGGVNSSATNAFPGIGVNFAGSTSETRVGWAAGLGLEWMLAPNWSFKAEYLHVDLGSADVRITTPVQFPADFADYRFHHAFDSARIGMNYHFGGPIVAKY